MKAKGLVADTDYDRYFAELFGVHRAEVPPCREFKQEHEIIQLIHDAGGIAILAHPHEQLQYMDTLMEMCIEGLEVWHGLLTEAERNAALKLAYERDLYISGGSDHRGLCSGYYERYEDLSKCPWYVPPLSLGTTKEHFEEIKNRKLNRY